MAPPAGPVETAPPRWTVAAVAQRLGVAPATLRSWSHRYGIGPAEHRPGRYRRYTDSDVAELETMQRLADDGMVLTSAAAVARRRHRGAPEIETHTGDPSEASEAGDPGVAAAREVHAEVPHAEVHALVQAAQRLEADTLVHTLEASLARRDVATTWNQLARPGLAALEGPSSTTACLDGALALAWAVATSLRRRLPATALPAPHTRRVLLACSPGEHHTLPLDALLAALAEHHLPAQTLGPAVPTSALLHAAEHTGPTAVFVWAHRPATARPSTLRRLLPHADTVAAAGPGWSTSRLPTATRWVNTLDDAVHLAHHTAGTPPPASPDRTRAAR